MLMETEHTRGAWSLLQREQELAQLERFVDNVEHQALTRQIVVAGLPGTGRTALLREMARRASSRGRSVGSGVVAEVDGLPRAIVDAFEEAIGSMIAKRPGAPALYRMKEAVASFADATLRDPVDGSGLAHAIDQLLPSLTFDRDELQSGYLVTIDDLQRADAAHVRALLEGLVAMSVTGAPLGVIVAAGDPTNLSTMVSEPDDLEIVTLQSFDHAAVRSIVSQCGVSMLDGGLRRLEEITLGRAGDLFPLLSELSLRRGNLGAADVDEVLALLHSDERLAGVKSATEWVAPWGGGRAHDRSDPVVVSADMIRAALDDAMAQLTVAEDVQPATPFVPRLLIGSGGVNPVESFPVGSVPVDVNDDLAVGPGSFDPAPFDSAALHQAPFDQATIVEHDDALSDEPVAFDPFTAIGRTPMRQADAPAAPLEAGSAELVSPYEGSDDDEPFDPFTARRVDDEVQPAFPPLSLVLLPEPPAPPEMPFPVRAYEISDVPEIVEELESADDPFARATRAVVVELAPAAPIEPTDVALDEVALDELAVDEVAVDELAADEAAIDDVVVDEDLADDLGVDVTAPGTAVMVEAIPEPVVVVTPVPPKHVSPAQRRVLRTVADLREQGTGVTVAAVRRQVGDLNRFTGVSPVVEAIEALLEVGLLNLRGTSDLELTSAGVTALLASA